MQERPTKKPGIKVFRIPRVKPWRIILPIFPQPKPGGIPTVVLIYGFIGLIAVGTLLLTLPISSKTGQITPPVNALFTATSAVCVTGLAVVDTGTYWSYFGQGVLIALIQIGGFGFMTSATIFLLVLGHRIGLRERLLIGESMGIPQPGGLIRLVRRMAFFTILVELLGAALLYIRFSAGNHPGLAAWKSIFHAVSAFNNCGLDLFSNFRSLMGYQGDTLVILVTAALIILGGISFMVVADLVTTRRLARLSLNSKIVLTTTLLLLVVGTIVILLTEYFNSATLGTLPFPQKMLNAFFMSVTPRTAGFSTVDVGKLGTYTLHFIIILMFIGGATGSTAGGIKVNTFGMLMLTIWSSIQGMEHARAFGREFTTTQVYRALAVLMLSLGIVAVATFALTVTEQHIHLSLLFETVSAFGTVGLSTGITPFLSTAGRLIVTITMFVGRLGPLTIALSLLQRLQPSTYRQPEEAIRIG